MLTLSQYPFTQIKGNTESEAAGDRRGCESGNRAVISSRRMWLEQRKGRGVSEGWAPCGLHGVGCWVDTLLLSSVSIP